MRDHEISLLVFDVLEHDQHKPLVNGKANRESIHDYLVRLVYNKSISPIRQHEADVVCELVDNLIEEFGETK